MSEPSVSSADLNLPQEHIAPWYVDISNPLQLRFLDAFALNPMNIHASCMIAHVSPASVYRWLKNDILFFEHYMALKFSVISLAEDKLLANVKKGRERSIIFLLNTLGRDLGYVERKELEGNLQAPNLTVEFVDHQHVHNRNTNASSD